MRRWCVPAAQRAGLSGRRQRWRWRALGGWCSSSEVRTESFRRDALSSTREKGQPSRLCVDVLARHGTESRVKAPFSERRSALRAHRRLQRAQSMFDVTTSDGKPRYIDVDGAGGAAASTSASVPHTTTAAAAAALGVRGAARCARARSPRELEAALVDGARRLGAKIHTGRSLASVDLAGRRACFRRELAPHSLMTIVFDLFVLASDETDGNALLAQLPVRWNLGRSGALVVPSARAASLLGDAPRLEEGLARAAALGKAANLPPNLGGIGARGLDRPVDDVRAALERFALSVGSAAVELRQSRQGAQGPLQPLCAYSISPKC